MNKTYIGIAVVVIIIIGGVWYVTQKGSAAPATGSAATNFGTYQYECDEHVTFSMTPASDMSSIAIAPSGTGTYPPASTLVHQTATSGVLYTGNGIVFTAHGETVTLGQGDSVINCSPVPDPDNAPFNFGD